MSILKGYVDTPNGQIHFRQLKQVDGIPLVLFHQTASSSLMYESLMNLLADDFHTIALDTPGFGASFSPPKLFPVSYISDSLHASLTALGVESCFVFGHHTGSAIGLQMAFDYPNFIKKMVLSGAPLLSETQITSLKASLKPTALAEDGSHLTQVWERIRKRESNLPLETVHREVLLTQSAKEAAQGTYQAVFDQPIQHQLSSLDIPILLISGEHDTLRASLEPAYQLLKHGEMKVIPNEGAYICDQNPQAVADVIKDFIL